MNFKFVTYVGYRYWRSKKSNSFASFITFFAVTGIFLGVASLIIVSSVMNGLEGQLKNKLLGSIPQLTIKTVDPIDNLNDRSSKIINLPHVLGLAPSVATEAMAQSPSTISAVQLYGMFPRDAELVASVSEHIYPGSMEDLVSGKYRIILGGELARRLKVSIGEQVRLLSGDGVIYSPIGPVPSQRKFTLVGIFETGSQVDAHVAYVHYKDARRLTRKQPSEVNELRVFLDDPYKTSVLEDQIRKVFDKQQVSITDWRSTYGSYFAAVRMENNMMSLMLSLIILVAAFNIISSLVMMVIDKTTDVAVLKTQGLSTANVMGVFMIQGTFNAILGLIAGLVVGVIISLNLNDILSVMGISILGVGQSLPVVIEGHRLLVIGIGTLAISLLATIYPALSAAKVEPANALRHE
ncbi:lipoprotein-releasing ABC transporter permease subunit [Parashewanella spongiae]|uniref:Lipoprotein-releasing ABC transporter permease subunit n=1 Tax=Parashewanella spongiae TaxID=342950 RepID=A0A3A6TV89_9GAMM|nr:lipoprotein-releasing ABC transporter permease subunit [Parashewanella spongiae]MCL1077573.1 lipoprotein-releasing ABC transporter permease subunit [Parashewanella spongiae]RJY18197.1 lipoprotein-releasing ABC transporter permease subunit [Parashewanella spongiae]